MKVKEIMTTHVATVTSSEPIRRAAETMIRRHCGSLPVMDGEKVAGIITDRDMAVKAIAEGKGPDTAVEDIMTGTVITCSPETEGSQAAKLMAQKQIRRLPVIEQGKLVGILSLGDVARADIPAQDTAGTLSDISRPTHQPSALQ